MEQYLWTEKYRPAKVDDCILPDYLKETFNEYVKTGNIPNLLLTGGPGVGKTTAAKAMCTEIGCDFMMINGSEERGIDMLRTKIKSYASSVAFDGRRKVVIIDEADYLTPEAQAALRGSMEEFAINCSFIFTCNFKGRLIEAIHSRCSVIEFKLKNGEKAKMASSLMKRLEGILNGENITFDKKVLAKVIEKHFPDYRRILNELQRYASSGAIDEGILAQVMDVTIKDLIKFLKEKDFSSMRKWVGQNSDMDHAKLYRRIYEGLYEYLKPQSIPQAVIILGEYQYKAAFVADLEINTVACLTMIMMECEFV